MILDYGGGFGTLAKEIAKITPLSEVDIYEPYASKYAYENIQEFKNIKIVINLKENYYDVLANTDILEHTEKPTELIAIYNKCLKKGGMLISHWNFLPAFIAICQNISILDIILRRLFFRWVFLRN